MGNFAPDLNNKTKTVRDRFNKKTGKKRVEVQLPKFENETELEDMKIDSTNWDVKKNLNMVMI